MSKKKAKVFGYTAKAGLRPKAKNSHSVPATAPTSDLKLKIPVEVLKDYAAMQATAGKNEIGGIGIVKQIDDETYEVVRLYAATTSSDSSLNNMSGDDVGSALFRAHEDGLYNTGPALFWHTHPDFGAFWSGTDVNAVEGQIEDGGVVINLLFSTPVKCIARLDYIEDFEKYNKQVVEEEKEILQQHRVDALEEVKLKTQQEQDFQIDLARLQSVNDIPPYGDIVKAVAAQMEMDEDSYFVRERALYVQQNMYKVIRFNQTTTAVEQTEEKVLKIKPVTASERKIRPNIISKQMEVEVEYDYIKQELEVITESRSSRYYSGRGHAAYGYNNRAGLSTVEEEDWEERFGPSVSSESYASGHQAGVAAAVSKAVRKKKTRSKDQLDLKIPDNKPLEGRNIICLDQGDWEYDPAIPGAMSGTLVEPIILSGDYEAEKFRFKLTLPLGMEKFCELPCFEEWLLYTIGFYAQNAQWYFLDIVTEPPIIFGDKVHIIDNLGDWLFGPYPYASRDCLVAVEIRVQNTDVALYYPRSTPAEGIELIDEGISAFIDECTGGNFDMAVLVDFIHDYHKPDETQALLDALLGILGSTRKDAQIREEVLAQSESDECLDPDFAEANRVILAMGG